MRTHARTHAAAVAGLCPSELRWLCWAGHELSSASAFAQSDGGYRVATSLWYLVDTEEGGETSFPGAPG